ncbi:MAG: sigma-54-dependent transcriptional regulator [Flavobacteriales bacterium]
MASILIIDDEKSIRNTLQEILEDEGFKVESVEDGPSGWEAIHKGQHEVVLCDIKMPEMDGMELLDKALDELQETPTFIMITGHGTIETAVEAIQKGAFDFLEKPLDLNRVLVSIRNAIDRSGLIQETRKLKRKVQHQASSKIIGNSEAIKEVRELIDRVAPTDARVLITGENGSGKELVARQLHEKSPRAQKAFIEVNCAAIPSELIESELFGHEKGAFTSAIKQRKGSFEQASGGTLFLDEIGDMSLSAQSKVLRTLQEHKITRVGGDKAINVDVRVIAASNKDLGKEIEAGNFREDLYHRLSVILIHVPSLRERKDDISILAEHFLDTLCEEHGMPRKKIDEKAVKALEQGEWSGNIREFRNVLERCLILSDDKIDKEVVENYAFPFSKG